MPQILLKASSDVQKFAKTIGNTHKGCACTTLLLASSYKIYYYYYSDILAMWCIDNGCVTLVTSWRCELNMWKWFSEPWHPTCMPQCLLWHWWLTIGQTPLFSGEVEYDGCHGFDLLAWVPVPFGIPQDLVLWPLLYMLYRLTWPNTSLTGAWCHQYTNLALCNLPSIWHLCSCAR